MLTFEQKLEILESFPQLERRDVSLKRVNFHYEQSIYDKKTVVYHLHPNGNAFVYAGLLEGCETDEKGFVNIRDYSAEALRDLVERSIRSLSGNGDLSTGEAALSSEAPAQVSKAASPQTSGGVWTNAEGQTLTLKYEDDLWYVYSGDNLDMAFETREEAGEYLAEEGFAPRRA
ncbi:hypothetical protein [Paenibacillus pinistramenti]|uniref:hypothetical protein n=1 Tax=Paenibacillus pinistramenti TaxID=1768003 RepID=UPI001107AF83|nr:hypothetical protein [Paenibacillus pinistramenti]